MFSFKKPSDEELDHNFLWRYMRALPERGRIAYLQSLGTDEDVLVVRVHPRDPGSRGKLPPGKRGESFWQERFDDINQFERHLDRNGTLTSEVLPVQKEQKRRFVERLDDPEKNWKFSTWPISRNGCDYWDAYQDAFQEMLRHTSNRSAAP